MALELGKAWWQGRFQIERACTCTARSAECSARGFHVVDSDDDQAAAHAEAARLTSSVGVVYRVVDAQNGQTV